MNDRIDRVLLAGLVAVPLFAAPAAAEIFFTTNPMTDQLLAIDSDTGHVTVVGPLGYDSRSIDLTTMNGRLYALDTFFENSVDLHELAPATGASLSSVPVELGGTPILHAEGLAHVGNQLKIGFRDLVTFQFTSLSNRYGDLSPAGVISNVEIPAPNLTDFDGLGVDVDSDQLYSPDVNPFGRPDDTDFYAVNPTPIQLALLHTDSGDLAINDVIVIDGVMWGIDNESDTLYALDLSTNIISPVVLDLPGPYLGLTTGSLPTPTPVPMPRSLGVLLLIALGWVGARLARASRPRAIPCA